MLRVKLTDRWISTRPAPNGKRQEVADALMPGLYLRIGKSGVKSFSVVARTDRVRRYSLGRYPALSLADARERARQLQRKLSETGHTATSSSVSGITLADLVAMYVELHLKRNVSSWLNVERSLTRRVPADLAKRRASSITKREIIALLDDIVDQGTPHSAITLLKNLKSMYRWAIDRDILGGNPCEAIRPPVKTAARDRILTDNEIGSVLRACGNMPGPFSDMVQMLFYTGARRNEIANMRWSELDAHKWTLPAHRSKSRRANTLPLPPEAMAILRRQPSHADDGYVFSTTGGSKPSSNFAKNKRLLDKQSGTHAWTLHDIRRTARSQLAALGVPREVARHIVGHAGDKLDSIYDRHAYEVEKAEALRRLAARWVQLQSAMPS